MTRYFFVSFRYDEKNGSRGGFGNAWVRVHNKTSNILGYIQSELEIADGDAFQYVILYFYEADEKRYKELRRS